MAQCERPLRRAHIEGSPTRGRSLLHRMRTLRFRREFSYSRTSHKVQVSVILSQPGAVRIEMPLDTGAENSVLNRDLAPLVGIWQLTLADRISLVLRNRLT